MVCVFQVSPLKSELLFFFFLQPHQPENPVWEPRPGGKEEAEPGDGCRPTSRRSTSPRSRQPSSLSSVWTVRREKWFCSSTSKPQRGGVKDTWNEGFFSRTWHLWLPHRCWRRPAQTSWDIALLSCGFPEVSLGFIRHANTWISIITFTSFCPPVIVCVCVCG